jgi:hypothetical protein
LPPGDYDIHARVDQQPGESPFDVLMRVHKSRRKFTIAAGVDEVVLDLAAAAK